MLDRQRRASTCRAAAPALRAMLVGAALLGGLAVMPRTLPAHVATRVPRLGLTAGRLVLSKIGAIRRFSSTVRIRLVPDRPSVCFAPDCVDVSI